MRWREEQMLARRTAERPTLSVGGRQALGVHSSTAVAAQLFGLH